jgi:DNA-binding NarL/FixJ family response regulator
MKRCANQLLLFSPSSALRAGASGFLLKYVAPADLLRAVTVVARGEALLAPVVIRTLISESSPHPPRPTRRLTGTC